MSYRKLFLGGAVICISALCLWLSLGSKASSSDNEDLLDLVYAGCKNAVSVIKTGKGRVVVRQWRLLTKGTPEAVHTTESTYELVFTEDRIRVSIDDIVLGRDVVPGEEFLPILPGNRTRTDVVINGRQITEFIPERKTATISDGADSALHFTLMRRIGDIGRYIVPTRGLLDIGGYVRRIPSDLHPDVQIISRETIDGTECTVLQLTISQASGAKRDHLFWISPERGFTVLRARVFSQAPGSSDRMLTDEENVEVKNYGCGIWYPTRITKKYYRHDEKGEPYVFMSDVITYDPDFKINGEVKESDLTLDLPTGTQVYDKTLDATYIVQ